MPLPDGLPAGPAADDPCQSAPSLHWTEETGWSPVTESLAVEEPLAIEIAYDRAGQDLRKVLAVTMRTPGSDDELALGFLLAEGLIAGASDVMANTAETENARGEKIATRRVRLMRPPREDLQRLSRGLITSSACGLCGRPSLEGLPIRPIATDLLPDPLEPAMLARLPEILRKEQRCFTATGGCHGAALCEPDGRLVLAREDVGRHNAVDKLIGAALLGGLPLGGKILVLSGRASFELVQKSAAAGVPVIIAVGAPSSLAVTLAHAAGITLVGFSRETRCNVYTHAGRVAMAGGKGAARPAPIPRPRTGI